MSLRIGDKVQVWSDTERKCLGWGKIIQIANFAKDQEEVPLIQLESGKLIWGDRCAWITERKAVEAGIRIWKAVHEE